MSLDGSVTGIHDALYNYMEVWVCVCVLCMMFKFVSCLSAFEFPRENSRLKNHRTVGEIRDSTGVNQRGEVRV